MTRYYYADTEGTALGPETGEKLLAMYTAGTINRSTPVIEEGASEWKDYLVHFPGSGASGSPLPAVALVAPPPPVRPAAPPEPPRQLVKPIKRYYYADEQGNAAGPLSRDELVAMKRRGTITGSTQVIAEGETVWSDYSAAIGPVNTDAIKEDWGKRDAKAKGFLRNPAWYVGAYLVAILPTYVLPYAGSNSASARVACATSNFVTNDIGRGGTHCMTFLNVMLALHMLCFVVIGYLAFARGSLIGKKWLLVFPVLAAFFDLMPGFSSIPLFPTILNVIGIVVGAAGGATIAQEQRYHA